MLSSSETSENLDKSKCDYHSDKYEYTLKTQNELN